MIDAPSTQARLDRIDRQERRSHLIQIGFLVALLIVIAAPFVLLWWFNRNPNIVHDLKAENMRVIGPTALCPGDNLIVTYDFRGTGRGLVLEDGTFYKMVPPRTIIPSETVRYILDGDFDRQVTRIWQVPSTYIDEATGESVPMEPGEYKHYYALSAPSRGAIADVNSVVFSVRSDCHE